MKAVGKDFISDLTEKREMVFFLQRKKKKSKK